MLAIEKAADLHWLAFLLTGERAVSIEIAADALELADGNSPFFAGWISGWSRRLVIAQALSHIRVALAGSARSVALSNQKIAAPHKGWRLDQDASKLDLERALLAIELFPRCALLLTTFEKLSVEDAAILLDVGGELVRKGRTIGLRALTSALAAIPVTKFRQLPAVRQRIVSAESECWS